MSLPYNKPAKPPAEKRDNGRNDPWSLRIGRVFGIPIRLHFTFLLVLIYFAISDIGMGGAFLVITTLGLFLCVALHELGHSLVAQRYGYPVRDITLYPIGGVAAIEGSPKPRHELYIALAGPAVNVVIGLLLYIVLALTGGLPATSATPDTAMQTLSRNPLLFLLGANIMLALFNMIPAFPMDGGRVLRALLGLRMGKARATQIAATIGQFVAILMGLYGLFGPQRNFGLVLIAVFVYFGAGREREVEEAHEVVEDAPVQAAMVKEFHTLSVGDTLRIAAQVLLDTNQQDFPVMHGQDVVGVLSRSQLLRALASEGESGYVAGAMGREVVFARIGDSLEEYMLRDDGVQRGPVLVTDDLGHLVGMLTVENLMEFLTLRQIARVRNEVKQS